MEQFFGIIVIAIFIEGLVSYVKSIVVDRKIKWQVLGTITLGVICAVAYKLDALALLGLVAKIPYFGVVLTGIALSRGSNYLFDFLKSVGGIIDKLKAKTD